MKEEIHTETFLEFIGRATLMQKQELIKQIEQENDDMFDELIESFYTFIR